MTMFEISAHQIEVLSNPLNDTFVQIVPDETKDDIETYKRWMEQTNGVLELVHEGMLLDITEQCSDFIAKQREATGRNFRAYEQSPMAKLMFRNPKAHATVN